MSSSVSPRAIWLSAVGSVIALPPSWPMAASKEMRVRVDAFSKRSSSERPSSVRTGSPARRFAFSSRARVNSARYSSAEKSASRKKSRFTATPP